MQDANALHIVAADECDRETLYDFIGEAWKDHSGIDLGESCRQRAHQHRGANRLCVGAAFLVKNKGGQHNDTNRRCKQ